MACDSSILSGTLADIAIRDVSYMLMKFSRPWSDNQYGSPILAEASFAIPGAILDLMLEIRLPLRSLHHTIKHEMIFVIALLKTRAVRIGIIDRRFL